MESTDPVVAGSGDENLVYTVTAMNKGPSDATGVVVRDFLNGPAGVRVDSLIPSAGTTFNALNLNWTIGNLPSGASASLTVVFTVESSARIATDAIENRPSVIAVDQNDRNPSNDTAAALTSISNEFDIAITKADSVDPVRAGSAGGTLVYTITAANSGPSDASRVRIGEALTLPDEVTIESVIPSTGSYIPADVKACGEQYEGDRFHVRWSANRQGAGRGRFVSYEKWGSRDIFLLPAGGFGERVLSPKICHASSSACASASARHHH